MAKRLEFQDSDSGAELFQYLWDGLVLGSLQFRANLGAEAPKNAKARTREEAKIQRALIKISEPTVDQTNRPVGARDLLMAGPQVVIFEVDQLELIENLLQAWPFGGAQQIPLANLYDFLSQLPDVTATT